MNAEGCDPATAQHVLIYSDRDAAYGSRVGLSIKCECGQVQLWGGYSPLHLGYRFDVQFTPPMSEALGDISSTT